MKPDEHPFETVKETVANPVMIQSVNIGREELGKAVALKGRQETTAEVQAASVERHLTEERIHIDKENSGIARAAGAVDDPAYYSGVTAAETHSRLAEDANTTAHSAEELSSKAAAAAAGTREEVRVRQAVAEEAEELVIVQQEVARRVAADVENRTAPDVTEEQRKLAAAENPDIAAFDADREAELAQFANTQKLTA